MTAGVNTEFDLPCLHWRQRQTDRTDGGSVQEGGVAIYNVMTLCDKQTKQNKKSISEFSCGRKILQLPDCACMCALTSSIILVCVEQLQACASSQQSLRAVQTGSHRLTDLLCRQGALCTQQHIKHTQLAGREHRLGVRDRRHSLTD